MAQETELQLESAGRSDVGTVARGAGRPEEDSLCMLRLSSGAGLYAVADGVGTRKGGSVASAQAINLLEEAVEAYARHGEALLRQLGDGFTGGADYLRYVFTRIDSQLRQNAENNLSVAGMATTLTAAYVDGPNVCVAHVGDSRAYRIDGKTGAVARLTIDDGPVSSDEFDPDPGAALGYPVPPSPRVSVFVFEPGDILLLCTDGLWREVDDALLQRIVVGSPAPAVAVERLIRAANQNGGRGNVAAVAVHLGRCQLANDAELDELFPPSGARRLGGDRAGPLPLPRAEEEEPSSQERAAAPEPAPAVAPTTSPAPAAAAAVLIGDVSVPGADAAPLEDTSASPPPPDALTGEAQAVAAVLQPRTPSSEKPPGQGAGLALGPFLVGMAVGIVGTVLCAVALLAVRDWLGRGEKPTPAATAAIEPQTVRESPEEEQETREVVFYPLQVWSKPGTGPDGRACVLQYKSFDKESGEVSWQQLATSINDDSREITMFRDKEGVHAVLDITFATNPDTKEPYSSLLTIKFRPPVASPETVTVKPGPHVDKAKAIGFIEIVADKPGDVTLTEAGGSTDLLAEGPIKKSVHYKRETGKYHLNFEGVPLGTYTVRKGTQERSVSLTVMRPRAANLEMNEVQPSGSR